MAILDDVMKNLFETRNSFFCCIWFSQWPRESSFAYSPHDPRWLLEFVDGDGGYVDGHVDLGMVEVQLGYRLLDYLPVIKRKISLRIFPYIDTLTNFLSDNS